MKTKIKIQEPKPEAYRVVAAVGLNSLQLEVSQLIEQGMIPIGGIGCMDNECYCRFYQAMCSPSVLVNTKLMDQLDTCLEKCRERIRR